MNHSECSSKAAGTEQIVQGLLRVSREKGDQPGTCGQKNRSCREEKEKILGRGGKHSGDISHICALYAYLGSSSESPNIVGIIRLSQFDPTRYSGGRGNVWKT